MIKKLVLLIGLSFIIVGCASDRYVGNANYMQANEEENPARMGMRYLLGRGVPQNDAKAFDYFLTAAKDDDPFAQNEVAFLYAAGKGTAKNDEKAFYYYQKAANHGLVGAEYNLGLMYARGQGVAQNQTLARQWMAKAAARGFEPAKQALTQSNLT